MPPQCVLNLQNIDLDRVLFDRAEIERVNPQRGDMLHLDGVVHIGPEGIIGFKDVRDDEFWVPGHIPGRPLLPGVIMIEAAAQCASFFTRKQLGWEGFIGFGGVEGVKFRQPVPPGVRMILVLAVKWERHRRVCCAAQGWVKGSLAFEGDIIGTVV